MHDARWILKFSCQDAQGILAAVTGALAAQRGFIAESAQYGDASTGRFFMRVEFALTAGAPPIEDFRASFERDVGRRFGLQWELVDKRRRNRVLIMLSKSGHCLNDLLYRHATGQLAIDVPAIVSNHETWKHVAAWHDIPFHHLPVTPETKPAQEARLLALLEEYAIDTLVLARYMQVLSPEVCRALTGRAINIHHSFLPSFQGARPYHQAFERGVKLIGATAHYVTTDLDEGPIIDQAVERVDHTQQPEDLAAVGHDIESLVLSRALKYHTEHRVLLDGNKTVVFR